MISCRKCEGWGKTDVNKKPRYSSDWQTKYVYKACSECGEAIYVKFELVKQQWEFKGYADQGDYNSAINNSVNAHPGWSTASDYSKRISRGADKYRV